jgi:hypothetical protein
MNTSQKKRRHNDVANIRNKANDVNEWERFCRELDLRLIDATRREDVRKAFVDGDANGFLNLDNTAALALVIYNVIPLRRRGIYEAVLFNAFVNTRVNHQNFQISRLEHLFALVDREKFLAAGDPLPDGETFVVYRGVAGVGKKRRISTGYSWTLRLMQACWFANRGRPEPDPAVYTATVSRSEILAFYNGRNEQEVICRPLPTNIRRLPLTLEEIEAKAKEWFERRRQRELAAH